MTQKTLGRLRATKGRKTRPAPDPFFYHVTPDRNVTSIAKQGILTDRARTRRKVIWLVQSIKVKWAISHIANRYGLDVWDVSAILVVIAATRLRREKPGIYTCDEDIPVVKLHGPLMDK